MLKKFTISLEENLRMKIKGVAALNGYPNMNDFVIQAIEEKIESLENNSYEKQDSKPKAIV